MRNRYLTFIKGQIGLRECNHIVRRVRKRQAAYLATNQGSSKVREYRRNIYRDNKELILQVNKEWREENKERRKEYLLNYERTKRTRDPQKKTAYAVKAHKKDTIEIRNIDCVAA